MSRPKVEVILKAYIATGTFHLIHFLNILLCAKHLLYYFNFVLLTFKRIFILDLIINILLLIFTEDE